MPVYNCVSYLQQALDSLLQQTFQDFELIMVDDGSTDGTCELAHLHASRHSNFTLLQQNHAFAGAARNLGMKTARGTYLLFLDGDDVFYPHLLQHAHEHAERNQADIVVYRATSLDDRTGRTHDLPQTCRANLCPSHTPFNRDTNTRNIFCFTTPAPWNKLFRASFVHGHALQFQNTRSANDFCFVLDALALAKRIVVLDEPLIYYRQHNATSLQATQQKDPLAFFEALRCLRQTLHAQGLFEQLEHPYINLACDFCMYNLRTLAPYPASQRIVFDFLKETGLNELGLEGKPRDYFYVYPASRWTDLQLVEHASYETYAKTLAKCARRQKSLFYRGARKIKRLFKSLISSI